MVAVEKQGTFWSRLTRPARIGLLAGVTLIVAGAVAVAVWSTRTDYAVLFSQLNEGDAANVVAQLKQQKIPYRLEGGGATVEVPAAQVYDTRLSLFSSGLPLSGGVGFAIYDHQGYGLTEEDQRVEYQRALQGELSHTIDSLEGVKYARVHLVIPPDTIFKSDREPPSAAVSLVLQPGASLTSAQVEGIQRLVAASVANLRPAAVIVNDQRGITLSAVDPSEAGLTGSNGRLAVEREVESYLQHKIAALLDRAYGPGQALVSVDVALNFDQVKTTVQSLVPLAGAQGGGEGAVLRKQQVETGGGGGGSASLATGAVAGNGARASDSTTDVEYEYGRRVEQIVAAPGNITHMSIGVIVPGTLTDDKQQRISELVGIAAGASEARGDEIDVEPLDALASGHAAHLDEGAGAQPSASVSQPVTATAVAAPASATPAFAAPAMRKRVPFPFLPWNPAGLGAIALVIGTLVGLSLRQRARRSDTALTETERQALLAEIEQALAVESGSPTRSGA